MAYQVLRVNKLKSAACLRARIRHALRDRVPENADLARAADNTYSVATSDDVLVRVESLEAEERTRRAMARFRDLLPAKFRKDAVQAIEILVTGSPELMNRYDRKGQDQYFNESFAWLAERFGGVGNVIAVTAHRDETTPHMSIFVVPRVEREIKGEKGIGLSAKAYINGPKDLSQLQTDFNEAVAKHYKFERGRIKSTAKHMNIHEYYTLTTEVARKVNLEREQKRQAAREKKKKQGELEL